VPASVIYVRPGGASPPRSSTCGGTMGWRR